ncbi:hypothetical protein QBC32DRAFT_317243 [Pseudoneurospora amorphoporcata]|uniref:Uncharacterized protein n=1 Tax=Pseudoneurospora amorphoporcata TaxID=241081 RepID=A0AAN6NNA0_9PEZI|nr:hypothetical protein QBC32DRAFT_317243 [Pseudoneurospora amorphoporcata]
MSSSEFSSESASESKPYRASLFLNPSVPSTVYLVIYPGHSHGRVVSAFKDHRRTRNHHAAFTTISRGTTTSTSPTTNTTLYPPYRSTRFPERSQRSSRLYRRSSRPVFPNPAPTYELDPDASYFRDPSHPAALVISDPDRIAERVLHDTHRRLYQDTLHCLLWSETTMPDFYHRAQFGVFKMSVDARLWDEDVVATFHKFGKSGGPPIPVGAEMHEKFLGILTNEKAKILDWSFFEWSESETDPSFWPENWHESVHSHYERRPRTDWEKDMCVTTAIDRFLDDDFDVFVGDTPNSLSYGPDGETYEAVMKVFRSLGDREDVWEQWEGSRDAVRFMDAWGWVLERRSHPGR